MTSKTLVPKFPSTGNYGRHKVLPEVYSFWDYFSYIYKIVYVSVFTENNSEIWIKYRLNTLNLEHKGVYKFTAIFAPPDK